MSWLDVYGKRNVAVALLVLFYVWLYVLELELGFGRSSRQDASLDFDLLVSVFSKFVFCVVVVMSVDGVCLNVCGS